MDRSVFRRCIAVILGSVSLSALSTSARADSVTLNPIADNTMFFNLSAPADLLSSGSGTGIYVGRTNFHADILHRGLIRFDLSAIPCGSTIDAVSLKMTMDRAPGSSASTVTLHRVLSEWGEGNSSSFGGAGDVSQSGDANWHQRRHPDLFWTNPGGDFSIAASASAVVPSTVGTTTWASNAAFIADVYHWIETPSENFGWLLQTVESAHGTVRRFVSREGGGTSRPSLRIDFTPPPVLSILSSPQSATTCQHVAAAFQIVASGAAPIGYQWEIETPGGTWIPLYVNPGSFLCSDVGTGTAAVDIENAAAVHIAVVPCPGIRTYQGVAA